MGGGGWRGWERVCVYIYIHTVNTQIKKCVCIFLCTCICICICIRIWSFPTSRGTILEVPVFGGLYCGPPGLGKLLCAGKKIYTRM